MIRMIQSTSAAHAKKYFSDALAKSDYYINDQELQGHFTGLLAQRLGISGPAEKKTFYKLCDNINPATGRNLTPRSKEERTTGYDVSFHVPKSVSIIHALANDDHIIKCFEASVEETLKEIEADSMTRVRKGGKDENRRSGELIIAQFTHQTARPVDGKAPDMHLHRHAYIFNSTYDPIEKQIKAGQFRDIKRDMPYYQARYHKLLSDKLIDLGYDIHVTGKAFEIAGVPESVIKHFSKRTNEIGQVAKELGITDIEELAALGARTRNKKQNGLSMQELKKAWKEQINEHISFSESERGGAIRFSGQVKQEKLTAKDCIDHTLDHSFERASVIQDRRLLATGIIYSIGERHISIEQIENTIATDQRIINVTQKGTNYCTKKDVLAEEREMVQLARRGKGRFKPLYNEAPKIAYDGDQGAAIKHVLTSSNQTSIIRGVAGAGKTTSLLELDKHIQAAGKKAFYVTPMAKTAREQMPMEGFKNSETVSRLLHDHKLQNELKGQVLIVDEAGQLGTSDMTALLHVSNRQNCRLILVGDTRQHNAVLRGDALRIINTVADIPTAEVSKIYRQQGNPQYLEAVKDLSSGKIETGFEKLDKMGAIKTIDPLKPNNELVDEYIRNVKNGKTALIVSPTHKQGEAITAEVRTELRKMGMISNKDTPIRRLQNLNLTEAEKQDWRRYKSGQAVHFNQCAPGIGKGSVWQLHEVNADQVIIRNTEGKKHNLPLNKGKAFTVFNQTEIAISKGDKVKTTHDGADIQGRRLSNGQAMEVIKINKNGTLHLRNQVSKANYTISQDYGHIDHDYYSTSHSAQGKTVDTVLISQPADTFTATDAKQFYVSVSRGRENVSIYTDDKEKLLEHASRLGDRTSAMELVGDFRPFEENIIRMEMERQITITPNRPEKDDRTKVLDNYFEDHEPRL